jgi:hypothetical protein
MKWFWPIFWAVGAIGSAVVLMLHLPLVIPYEDTVYRVLMWICFFLCGFDLAVALEKRKP